MSFIPYVVVSASACNLPRLFPETLVRDGHLEWSLGDEGRRRIRKALRVLGVLQWP